MREPDQPSALRVGLAWRLPHQSLLPTPSAARSPRASQPTAPRSRVLSDLLAPSCRSIQKGRPARVRTAAHVLSSIVYNNKDNLSVGLIVAGVDDVDGPQVYSIPLGGTLVRQPLAVGGSGSVFIYAMGDADYTPEMDKDAAVAFGRRLVSHAMARDGSSGGVIRSVVLTADGAERGYVPGSDLPFTLEGMADGLDKATDAAAERRATGAVPSSSSSSSSSLAASAAARPSRR